MNAKSNRRGGRRQNGPKGKRPYSTIELKATEVPTDDAKDKDAAAKSSKSSDTKSAVKSAIGTAAGAGAAAASSTKTATSRGPSGSSSGSSSASSRGPSSSSSGSPSSANLAASIKAKNADQSTSQSKSASGSVPGMGSAGKKASETTGSGTAKTGTSDKSAAAQGLAGSKSSGSGDGTGGMGGNDGKSGKGGKGNPPPPTPARRGGGFFSHMTAAIVGAGLTFFGASYATKFLADQGFNLPTVTSSPGASNAELENRVAALQKAVDAQNAGNGSGSGAANEALAQKIANAETQLAKLSELNKTIADLKASQAKLQQEAAALQAKLEQGGGGSNSALDNRISQMEQTLAALGAAAKNNPGKAGRIPQLAAISGRLNDLETALKTRLGDLRTSVVQEIDTRVAATSEASEAARSGMQRLDRDVNELRTKAAKMDQRLIELGANAKNMRETLRVVQEQSAETKTTLESLRGDLHAKFKSAAKPADVSAAVSPIAAKITSLEQNLDGVVKSEADRKSTAQRIVLALELGNLKRAMDRGQDFSSELAEVKRVAGPGLAFDALDRHKATGVATLGDLQKEFRRIAFKMIDAESLKENASVMEQFLHGAKSLVRVRQIDHKADDGSTEATVGRMERALKDGRLSDVLAEAKKLPPKALAPAQSWLEKVKARQSVDQAIADIEAKLKSSLSGKALGTKG